MKTLPRDIEILVTHDGVYLEIESFIRFLRSNENVTEEYKDEVVHLVKIAEYLEENMAEAIAQRRLLDTSFDTEKPN